MIHDSFYHIFEEGKIFFIVSSHHNIYSILYNITNILVRDLYFTIYTMIFIDLFNIYSYFKAAPQPLHREQVYGHGSTTSTRCDSGVWVAGCSTE